MSNQTVVIRKYFNNKYYAKNIVTSMQGVWDMLIFRVGLLCEFYRSDLVIDILDVHEKLTEKESFSQVFGIRESGVDGLGFILNRLGQHCYRELWRLDVDFNENDEELVSFYRIYEPTLSSCDVKEIHDILDGKSNE